MTPVLTFFNNNGGVGKTTLVYHLAWTFADMGKRVVVMDMDPQANLTAAFFTDDEIEEIWENPTPGATVFSCVKTAGVKGVAPPILRIVSGNIYILPGDAALSGFEETLSLYWYKSMNSTNLHRPICVLSAFWEIMRMAATEINADIILVDTSPYLSAINRSVLIATNHVVIPLGADLFSLQGLKNLGPALYSWKTDWNTRLNHWVSNDESKKNPEFKLPSAEMAVIGYVCRQHSIYMERPVRAYTKWVDRIPNIYRSNILNKSEICSVGTDEDPYCLAILKHYRNLVSMGQERRKPIFKLTSADGAVGAHANAVQDARRDFLNLAGKIAAAMGLE